MNFAFSCQSNNVFPIKKHFAPWDEIESIGGLGVGWESCD